MADISKIASGASSVINLGKSIFGQDKAFSVSAFRSSMNKGLGRPALFKFTLLRYPEIFFKPPKNGAVAGIAGALGSVSSGLGDAVGSIAGVADTALSLGSMLYQNTLGSEGISDLSFRVNQATIPDKTLETYVVRYYGVSYTYPRDVAPNQLTINILTSGNYWEHELFHKWNNLIMNYGGNGDGASFDIEYFDDIIADAELEFYSAEGDVSYKSTINEIYPISVTGVRGDWGAKNDVSSFQVRFAYSLCNTKKVTAISGALSTAGNVLSTAQKIL